MKTLEMLGLVLDHLETKKMCKHAVKKLSFVIDMFLIGIRLNKGTIGTLASVSYRYKN